MFSNGTEHIAFLESQCYSCKKYKDFAEVGDESKCCKIENRIAESAMSDNPKQVFPYDKLIPNNHMSRYTCLGFKDKSIKEVYIAKPLKGQISIFQEG